MTPAAFAFCQHCGLKVGVVDEVAVADTLATGGAADTVPDEVIHLTRPRASEPSGYLEITTETGGEAWEGEPADAGPEPLAVVGSGAAPAPSAFGQLVALQRDGSDGELHQLVDDVIDIGRSEGQLIIADDAFLAARHLRLERRADAVVLIPLDPINGVYVRVRPGEVVPLRHGDFLLFGKEVLRFEVLEPEERAQLPAIQHGVRLFGSPMRLPWARLMQFVQSGVARDVYHLAPAEVVLGREEGDLRFPDDEFMSRRHARIVNRDGHFELTDEGSSNGTYIRLRGERVLESGDRLRLGDQLFRYQHT
jgi:pSer/pThr/pTyr-binding forkhead associated (FHA) protein